MEISVINGMNAIPLYTKEAWTKLGNPVKTWEAENHAGRLAGYLEEVATRRRKCNRDRPYCVVTLDNDYVEWLKESGRKDSRISFKEYAGVMLASEMRERLKKSGLGRFYECVCMPVRLVKDDMIRGRELTENERRSLEKYVCGIYRDCDCCVIPDMTHPGAIPGHEDVFCRLSKKYFEDRLDRGELFIPAQEKPDPGLACLCILVFISGRCKEPVYKREDVMPGGRFCLEKYPGCRYRDETELFRQPPGPLKNEYKRERDLWENVVFAFAKDHNGALIPQPVFMYGKNVADYGNYMKGRKAKSDIVKFISEKENAYE